MENFCNNRSLQENSLREHRLEPLRPCTSVHGRFFCLRKFRGDFLSAFPSASDANLAHLIILPLQATTIPLKFSTTEFFGNPFVAASPACSRRIRSRRKRQNGYLHKMSRWKSPLPAILPRKITILYFQTKKEGPREPSPCRTGNRTHARI